MATQETLNQVQQLYVAYYGRPADAAGLAFWADELEANGGDVSVIINDFGNSAEFEARFGDLSNEELVNNLYQQLFGRDADAEGLAFYTGHLESGDLTLAQIASEIAGGAQDNEDGDNDLTTLNNKVAAANLYTAATEGQHDGTDADNYAAAWLAGIDAGTDVDAIDMDEVVANLPEPSEPVEPGEGETIRLTQRADDLQGADGSDTTFVAPVTQNETGSGALANTFETGDVLDGGAGRNTLEADLIATGTIQDGLFTGVAISAETTNIQEVYLRAQAGQIDNNADNTTFAAATIDAERMVGVEQWWTDNSRADVRIEDVRSRPTDTILGMRNTDPEVGFEVYFNPLFMDGGQSSQSQLVIQIAELDGGVVNTAAELANISVNALSFELDGDAITISSDAMAEANTWEELEAAIVAALAEEGLGDLQVTRGDEGQFLLFDAEGREFSNQGGFTASATTDEQIDIRNRITQDLQTQDEQTETTLVLDGAGNGSRGGDVNIAAMSGDRGVEVFNVQVDNDSHIRTLRSENNPLDSGSYAQEQQLEEVYLTHVEGGAQGAFQLGSRTVEQSGVSTTTDDRLVTDGLLNVRVFDAAGYAADIKLGASLTEAVFDKYLADAEETVQFSYLLGDGNNNLSLFVNNDVASDPDFALEIIGGAGDDRINLTGLSTKNSTVIDGGAGVNTVETNTSTGAATDGSDVWAGFENIQTLVVAGDNNTTQNLVVGNMGSLEQVVIATGNVDTNVQQMRMDQDLTISGKNQTLGQGNSNDDQNFGTVTISNTSAVPGVNSFGVLLDNTARVDGELTVAELNVDGADNAISTLDLTSAGRRDTSNLVQSATLAGVNTVNLDGSQNLDLHIADMATGASVVNGSNLGGDLDLAINGGLLTGAADVLTGTEATTDTLAIYGTDAQATVTGFETLQLGLAADNQFVGAVAIADRGFAGTFNAAAVSGVEQYSIASLSGAAELINLSGSEVINVAETDANQDLTLIASDRDTSNAITVNFEGDYSSALSVQDYRTVTLGLAEDTDYDFDLELASTGTNTDTYARTLEIVGGGLDSNGDVNTTLNIGDLDTALTTVDLSGYTGSLIGGTWAENAGSNAQVLVNAFDFSFDVEGDTGATEFITEFRFTTDADSFGTVWNIENFQVFGADATLQDRTLINLRDLGLTETDVSWTDGANFWTNLDADEQAEFVAAGNDLSGLGASDTVVTSNNDGDNFTIVLTGVTQSDLNDENFLYAS